MASLLNNDEHQGSVGMLGSKETESMKAYHIARMGFLNEAIYSVSELSQRTMKPMQIKFVDFLFLCSQKQKTYQLRNVV